MTPAGASEQRHHTEVGAEAEVEPASVAGDACQVDAGLEVQSDVSRGYPGEAKHALRGQTRGAGLLEDLVEQAETQPQARVGPQRLQRAEGVLRACARLEETEALRTGLCAGRIAGAADHHGRLREHLPARREVVVAFEIEAHVE